MINKLRSSILLMATLVLLLGSSTASAMYDPGTGRFMQRDPSGYPDGMNSYGAYHVMRGGLDPSGLEEEEHYKYVFDGGKICRMSYDKKKCYKCWEAVSGKPVNGEFLYSIDRQKVKNEGPIPEGGYILPADKVTDPSKDGNWDTQDWNDYEKNDGDGLNPFKTNVSPRSTSAWGDRFGRLTEWGNTDDRYGRSHFNIHGGDVPGSAGCIDVGCNDIDFYDDVRARNRFVAIVEVDYSGNSTKACDEDCPEYEGDAWDE